VIQEEFEYRVRMHTRHGGTHDLFVVAPDAFSARMKALEISPHHQPQSVIRVSECVL